MTGFQRLVDNMQIRNKEFSLRPKNQKDTAFAEHYSDSRPQIIIEDQAICSKRDSIS